ncbi:MAG: hypothetical protein JXA78_18070 [Anaerolineales bacterium]|nr:hypothetical protein [Anaerolineales bacterium]
MEILILVVAMILVGLLMGWLAGVIWKGARPLGTNADYLISVAVAVIVGLIDWFVIPAMGFSDTMKYLGVALEPALGALLALWVVRLAKRS